MITEDSKIKETDAEYTDLSQVWHSTDERPEIPSYAKFVCITAYTVTKDMQSFIFTEDTDWGKMCGRYGIELWAYPTDIFPKKGGCDV